ncbi:protein kinase [Metallosphaera tengchongensis]|uniref:Protein kinase n=1 Tax=Metallosphaera tengchongensis TaxID=1532350 RepID=A0A6N0NU10_9CREN|nr:protein kinase [Metallosphaera tengchongensis]QKR00266.1 protein kinase [Metallosphaera tengchongensis]
MVISNKAISVVYIILSIYFMLYLITQVMVTQEDLSNLYLFVAIFLSAISLSYYKPNFFVVPAFSIPGVALSLLSSSSQFSLNPSPLSLILGSVMMASSLGVSITGRNVSEPMLVPFIASVTAFLVSYSFSYFLPGNSLTLLAGVPLFLIPPLKATRRAWGLAVSVILSLLSTLISYDLVFSSAAFPLNGLILTISSPETWITYITVISLILILLGREKIPSLVFLAFSALIFLLPSSVPPASTLNFVFAPLLVGSSSLPWRNLEMELKVLGESLEVKFKSTGKESLFLDSKPLKFSCSSETCVSTSKVSPGEHVVKLCIGNECTSRKVMVNQPKTVPLSVGNKASPLTISTEVQGKKMIIKLNFSKKTGSFELKVNNEVIQTRRVNSTLYEAEYPLKSPGKYLVEVNRLSKGSSESYTKEVEVKSLEMTIEMKVEQRWPDLLITVETYVDGVRSSVDKIDIKVNGELVPFSNPDPGIYTAMVPTNKEGKYEIVVEAVKDKLSKTERKEVAVSIPSLRSWDPKSWVGRSIYGYEVEGILGIGGTSFVLLGSREKKRYAIKVVNIFPSSSGSQTRIGLSTFSDLSRESSKLQEISERSEEIVKLYGIYADVNTIAEILSGKTLLYLTNPPAIVMELMTGGTAEDLTSKQAVFLSSNWPEIVKTVFINIAKALYVVHSEDYVHLDVKPRNVFFSEDPGSVGSEVLDRLRSGKTKVKLGDLGSARRTGERISEYTGEYCPVDQVEAMLRGEGARPDMDVYALGATIYKLVNGSPLNPVEMVREMDTAVDLFLRRGDYRSSLQKAREAYKVAHASIQLSRFKEIEPLVKSMTHWDHTRRPSIKEVLDQLHGLSK